MFLSHFFGIIIGKGIGRIYKYDHQKWPHPHPNTTFVLPQRSDNSIQTQRNILSDASVGEYALESSVLDQNTIHHGNTDVNDNDD